MEARMQPRSDGDAALRAVSAEHDADVARLDVSGPRRQHRPSLRRPRTPLAADGDGRGARRVRAGAAGAVRCSAPGSWDRLDALTATGEFWDLQNASPFARPTRASTTSRARSIWSRGADPLATVRRLTTGDLRSLRVPPAEHACRFADRRSARGAIGRLPGLRAHHDRAGPAARHSVPLRERLSVPPAIGRDRSSIGATHAWVEALLPDIGWVGFDPTNNRLAEDRHIRVAIGRDYADVPPTRGVFKGVSAVRSELAVAVNVGPVGAWRNDPLPFVPWMSRDADGTIVTPSSNQQ